MVESWSSFEVGTLHKWGSMGVFARLSSPVPLSLPVPISYPLSTYHYIPIRIISPFLLYRTTKVGTVGTESISEVLPAFFAVPLWGHLSHIPGQNAEISEICCGLVDYQVPLYGERCPEQPCPDIYVGVEQGS